ncbi:TonB-dependent receptor [Oleiagrimonas sp.]|jgi:iron complex outermembrane receptor protein|uniref:TonB-dependent receptor n=1 Tax=Oleiagrimonas sp. TaxID=2010330 RepID=UPI002609C259|nr:TonB-dependent receptor [Oleiagrimonas sp.]MDA3913727.1 TonB-dependent receptor [Oleiagrimonas sp.]
MKNYRPLYVCVMALLFGAVPLTVAQAKSSKQQESQGAKSASSMKNNKKSDNKSKEKANSAQLQEVVVTAEHRVQNLQKVAASINVVSQEQIEQATTPTTTSLTQFSPSLTFNGGTTNLNQSFSIRGIGTVSFSRASEPSVSTVVDGVVYAASGMAFTNLLNMKRVEVLNGPQGTLFGMNSSAGAINIVTTDPTNQRTGYVQGSVFNDNEYRVRGLFSGPISSTLDGQVAYEYWNFDGNSRNFYNGKLSNGTKQGGVRSKLIWRPNSNLKGTFIADWSRTNDNCCGQSINIVQNTPFTSLVLRPQLGAVVPNSKNKNINEDTLPLTQDTNEGLSAEFDWSMPSGFKFVSISATRRWTNLERRDGDFLPGPPGLLESSVPYDFRMADHGHMSLDQYSQEFRIVSPDTGRFKYVAGMFLFHTIAHDNFRRLDTFCVGSTLPALPNGTIPCAIGKSTFVSGSGKEYDRITHNNYALYGQGTYSFTDHIRGILGLRYTFDKVGYNLSRSSLGGMPGLQPSFNNSDSATDNHVTGKIGLKGDLSDNSTAYVTYSTGYKSPAYNVFFNMTSNNTALISAETSKDYEAGVKSVLFDRRLQLNTSIFYTKFNGFQTNNFINVNGTIITNLVNAGTVSTKGLEMDFRARPIPGMNLAGGFAYTNAKVDKYNCPVGAPLTCEYRNGKQFATPKYRFVLNGDYELPLPSLPFVLSLDTNYNWQSAQTPISQAAYATQPAYGIWNIGLKASDDTDTYSVKLEVQNVLNTFYADVRLPNCSLTVVNGNVVPCASYVRQQVPRNARRIVGLVGRYNF